MEKRERRCWLAGYEKAFQRPEPECRSPSYRILRSSFASASSRSTSSAVLSPLGTVLPITKSTCYRPSLFCRVCLPLLSSCSHAVPGRSVTVSALCLSGLCHCPPSHIPLSLPSALAHSYTSSPMHKHTRAARSLSLLRPIAPTPTPTHNTIRTPNHSSPSFCPPLRQASRTYISTSRSRPAPSAFRLSPPTTPHILHMSFFSRLFSSFSTPSPENTMVAAAKAQKLIDENPAVVFSKSYCPYCRSAKRTLDDLGAKYTLVELDQEEDGSDIQEALLKISGQRTVPNIFIGKEHIGGNSDLESRRNKDLKNLLKAAGSLE
ncbi:glutaredoxin [Ophiostoma piceae UAMH 11346]|uniref:Glutaredoxin n=1 Tax=Ophiostoma piceae (strain UAMH 11346) TaxID=1262450 RepID=S3C727_OPHP1|nr:glutaredoxin [Ophiostoma piceae UAMH 11346]